MPIFLMFGRYSSEAIKGISSERTDKARELIEENDGKIISMYAVMGEHDLVFTIDFPGADNAMAASVALFNLTGIHFTTSPVVDVEQFDKAHGESKKYLIRLRIISLARRTTARRHPSRRAPEVPWDAGGIRLRRGRL